MERANAAITVRPPPTYRLLWLFMAALQPEAMAQKQADFLIALHPDSLAMYNQYQQRLSTYERDQLEPLHPMRIIDESTVLNDGFTPCMSVEIGGVRYYLQINDKGTPAPAYGFLKILRNVVPLDDTVRILKGGVVHLMTPGGSGVRLDQNSTIRRYFIDRDNTFVLHVSPNRRFGWVKLDPFQENKSWSIIKRTAQKGIPSVVADRIVSRLNNVNRRLQILYGYFSNETGRPRSAPQWQITMNLEGLVCILEGDSLTHDHWQSTQLLAREFEGYLLGTTMSVAVQPKRIAIEPRQ